MNTAQITHTNSPYNITLHNNNLPEIKPPRKQSQSLGLLDICMPVCPALPREQQHVSGLGPAEETRAIEARDQGKGKAQREEDTCSGD